MCEFKFMIIYSIYVIMYNPENMYTICFYTVLNKYNFFMFDARTFITVLWKKKMSFNSTRTANACDTYQN